MFAQTFKAKKPLDQDLIDQSIEAVMTRLIPTDPKIVYIFGSVADGTAHEDSDLDILAVYDDVSSIKSARESFYGGLKSRLAPIPVDLIYVTSKEFERKRDLGGVCYEASHSGTLIFERK